MVQFSRNIDVKLDDGQTERFVVQTFNDDAVRVDLSANGSPYDVDIQTASEHPSGEAEFDTADYERCLPLGTETYTDASEHSTASEVVGESVFIGITNNSGGSLTFTGQVSTHSKGASSSVQQFVTGGTGSRASAFRDGRSISNSESVNTDEENLTSKVVRTYEMGGDTYNDVKISDHGGDILQTLQYINDNLDPGCVVLPAGEFATDTSLSWTASDAAIVGAGGGVTNGKGTNIQPSPSAPASDPTITVTESGVTVRSLNIFAEKNVKRGIEIRDARRVHLSDVHILETTGAGIHIEGSGYNSYVEQATVRRCQDTQDDRAAVQALIGGGSATRPNGSLFQSLRVERTVGSHAFEAEANGCQIVGSSFENNDGAAIKFEAGGPETIAFCQFEGNNLDASVEPDSQRSTIVTSKNVQTGDVTIIGCDISTSNNHQHLTIGDGAEAGPIGVYGCRFKGPTDGGYYARVSSATSLNKVYFSPDNRYVNADALDNYSPNQILNNYIDAGRVPASASFSGASDDGWDTSETSGNTFTFNVVFKTPPNVFAVMDPGGTDVTDEFKVEPNAANTDTTGSQLIFRHYGTSSSSAQRAWYMASGFV